MGSSTATDISTEERVRAATLVCIGRWGLAKTTLDDIARESGVSRATIYRAFPGGKEVLIASALDAEVEQFFVGLAARLDGCAELREKLLAGIEHALAHIASHDALATVLQHEPELLMPGLSSHRVVEVVARTSAFVQPYLRPHVASDDDAEMRAEFLVRTVLSYALSPSRWLDLRDPTSIAHFVDAVLLPALTA